MNGKPGVIDVMKRDGSDGVLAVMDAVSRDRNGIPALDEARATVERLAEAAQFVLDKEWEYGEDQPAFARLNAALADFRGEA